MASHVPSNYAPLLARLYKEEELTSVEERPVHTSNKTIYHWNGTPLCNRATVYEFPKSCNLVDLSCFNLIALFPGLPLCSRGPSDLLMLGMSSQLTVISVSLSAIP